MSTSASKIGQPKAKSPYGQGYEDWIAFGDVANGINMSEPGFREYCQGKEDARRDFFDPKRRIRNPLPK